jgi:SAM-dependent methyltransferase
MTFRDHFSSHAKHYSAARPTYPLELIDVLAAATPQRRVAWDCGCGNGQLATLLAGRFERVLATDASAAQLDHATLHERVEYRCAPAEVSGLPDAGVDLTAVGQAAHWFDLPRFYAEVRRVSRGPDSVVALVTYGRHSVAPAVDDVVERFYSGPLAPHWPAERALVDAGYATLPFPFARLEVPSMAIEATWTLEATLAYIETWSAVVRLLKAEGPAPLDRFAAELRATWGQPSSRRVRWPLTVVAGRVGSRHG